MAKRVRSKPADIKQTPDNSRGTRHQTSEWREPMWHEGLQEQWRTDLKSSFLNGDLTVNSSAVIRTHRLQLVFIQREELSSCQNTQTVDGPEEIKHTEAVNHCSHDDDVMFTGRGGFDSHVAEALEVKPARHLLRCRVIRDVYWWNASGASGSLKLLLSAATQSQSVHQLVLNLLHVWLTAWERETHTQTDRQSRDRQTVFIYVCVCACMHVRLAGGGLSLWLSLMMTLSLSPLLFWSLMSAGEGSWRSAAAGAGVGGRGGVGICPRAGGGGGVGVGGTGVTGCLGT